MSAIHVDIVRYSDETRDAARLASMLIIQSRRGCLVQAILYGDREIERLGFVECNERDDDIWRLIEQSAAWAAQETGKP
ncbi:hypothetical protein MXD81_53775 [Microbacteriaceae bacterium K1510]|nr:hypothetical protein [Microbacteriaceae bacterium K1510]